MTVRLKIATALAATMLILGAGCGGGGTVAFTSETDDPYYREGQRLVRQGREAEALSAFLKVIEKRGEQASAEAHLEAGLIYLNHIKNPIEAIHHFRKYLELQPNAKQAPGVRSLIETATREFARTIPAHPLESQSVGIDQSEQVRQLQRENDDLRAALADQHTATTTQFLRSSRAPIDADETPPAASAPDGSLLIMPAPLPPRAARTEPTIIVAPLFGLSNSAPPGSRVASHPAVGAHKHTIVPGDTLFRISVKYFGNGSKVDDIFNANRDVMQNKNSLPLIGTELKIP